MILILLPSNIKEKQVLTLIFIAWAKLFCLVLTQQIPNWNQIEPTIYFDRYLKYISPKLVKILQKMICENQQQRYQSVVEVLNDLDREEHVVVLPSPFDFDTPATAEFKTNSAKSTPIRLDKILLWSLLILPFIISIFYFISGCSKKYRSSTSWLY